MAFQKTYRLLVTPMTYLRITQKSKWMFGEGITDEYLLELGKKKYNERVERGVDNPGSPNEYLNKKKMIQRYFNYKREVQEAANKALFMMQEQDTWMKFYIPMPKSWTKKKRNKMNLELHKSGRRDADNYSKAILDSLFKNDGRVADFRASKFWIDLPFGYIEFEIGTLPPAKGTYTKFVTGTDELK